ncbi:DUF5658 family protein [Bacillus rubiinfantis]|uniref:DUF5658 family protein n=1 Tax=Bacillus rubiinfantis TaxID=1499680 RepID=UPI0005A7DEDF|nr:DUF5658 family protein [Bacillus rubiinfantis]
MRFCLFLLFAGVLDAVMTHAGIALGLVKEANPLMRFVIELNWSLFYGIKIILPLLLVILALLRPITGKIKLLLLTACVCYSSILVYHLGWILLFANTAI